MPRLNPDRQIAHALQSLAVAERMVREARKALRTALKQRSACREGLAKGLPRSRPDAGGNSAVGVGAGT